MQVTATIMHQPGNPYIDAMHLLNTGYFQQACAAFAAIPLDSQDFDAAILWQGRCLIEQGRIRDAAEHWLQAMDKPISQAMQAKLRLWLDFISLYGVMGETASPRQVQRRLQAAASQADADCGLYILSMDLQNRLLHWGVTFGWEPADAAAQLERRLLETLSQYRQIEDQDEALRASHRLLNFYRAPHRANPEKIRQFLEAQLQDVQGLCRPEAEADYRLALLELEFDEALQQSAEPELMDWAQRFDALQALYQQAGHAYGTIKIHWGFAKLLMKYAYSNGGEIAWACLAPLQNTDEIILRQEILQDLHLWYTNRGDGDKVRECAAMLDASSRLMAIPFQYGLNRLGQADQAFRSGRYRETEKLLDDLLSDPDLTLLQFPAKLIRVSLLSRIGRPVEAMDLVKEVIHHATIKANTIFLTDALLLSADLNLHKDDPGGLQNWADLLELDRRQSHYVAEAQHLAARGWYNFQIRMRKRQQPLLDEEILKDFAAAENLLTPRRTLEARQQLGNLYQYQGQMAFIVRDWENCGRYLNQAEKIFRDLELRPSLAFTLLHQGLALIELGRQGHLSCYQLAQSRFIEAEQLFAVAGVRGMLWNSLFYQGIAEREAGGLETSPSREERWCNAQRLFLRASQIIDTERDPLTEPSTAQTQINAIAFIQNKQELYREGFQLACDLQADYYAALQWLELNKSRVLLDNLAARQAIAEGKASLQLENVQRLLTETSLPDWQALRQTLADEQKRYSGGNLLIAQYYCDERKIMLIGLRADWETPRLQRIDINLPRLKLFHQQWFSRPDRVRHSSEQQWQQFKALVEPLQEWAAPDDRICLIPHRYLHDLPLHTLPLIEGNYLGERNIISYAPSLMVLYHVIQRPQLAVAPNNSFKAVVMGDPEDNLPWARQEANINADVLNIKPLLGKSVTKPAVLQALATADVLLYSGHAEDGGFQASLMLAKNDCLTAAEILKLPRTPAVVVLGGCGTGINEKLEGDELLGFVRAFLLAGSRAVVVSQWPVNDKAAAALLNAFIKALFKGNIAPAAALREAMKAVRERAEWQHFYYWGGFILVGAG